MAGREDAIERGEGRPLQLVFNGFGPELSLEEIKGTIQKIFDYMFDGSLNQSFLKDLRKQAPAQGWVVTSGIVVSEKPVRQLDQLSENERELEALKQQHFRYPAVPIPNHVFEATGYR